MKVLCIDTDSNGLDVLMRARQYGHEVMWWDKKKKDGSDRRSGEGIIPKLRDFDALRKKWIGWADLIWLCGNTSYMDLLEPYRLMGYPIYGGGVESALWESDRTVGQRIMKECGLAIIPYKEFTDYDSAIAYVRREGKPFVSKPSGDADKALSYVANSAADLVYMLQYWKENPKYVADAKAFGFILQEKKVGCEMGVGGWYGPGGWSAAIEENWEYKKLMVDDLGVNTGEQGTLLRFVKKSKLADVALFPLEKKLKQIGYVGNVDVNGCIDEDGEYWPYELTMREGWPAKHNQVAMQEGDPVRWMLDLVNGKDTMKVRNECSISVVASISKEIDGAPIYGATDMDHVHLCEARLADSKPVQAGNKVIDMPCYATAGDYVLVVTGTGETITGARRSAYTALEKIKMPHSPSWRTDIGKGKLVQALEQIQRHGFAAGLSY